MTGAGGGPDRPPPRKGADGRSGGARENENRDRADRAPGEEGGRRILVVGPAWIGDMVMAQSLYRLIARREPRARIDVLAPDWSREIVRRMPEVSDVIPLPAGHGELRLGVRWRIARRLRERSYDQAIVAKRSLKSALIPWMARIPRRTGILGEWRYGLLNDIRSLDDGELPLTAHRYAALGLEPGEELDPGTVPGPRLRADPDRGRRRMEELGLEADGPVAGLAPGAAYGPSKRWPPERWAELAADLGERGWRLWVFGTEEEGGPGRTIEEAAPEAVRDLTGRTSLLDVVDLMARCRAVVSNDSGLMHVASGLDTHVVALFGSTSPRRTPPLTPKRTLLWLELPCSPCFEPTCPLGHRNCLRHIGAEEVRDAVLTAVDAPDPGGGVPRAAWRPASTVPGPAGTVDVEERS